MSPGMYAHIDLTEDGIPFLSGTQTKVEEVVLDHLAHGWEAGEIHRQHPHLTLAQIHSALAYYYDHQAKMDRFIRDNTLEAHAARYGFSVGDDGRLRFGHR